MLHLKRRTIFVFGIAAAINGVIVLASTSALSAHIDNVVKANLTANVPAKVRDAHMEDAYRQAVAAEPPAATGFLAWTEFVALLIVIGGVANAVVSFTPLARAGAKLGRRTLLVSLLAIVPVAIDLGVDRLTFFYTVALALGLFLIAPAPILIWRFLGTSADSPPGASIQT